MITFVPTTHGAGVRLWGTREELQDFYDTVERYWNCLEEAQDSIEYQRDNILACFCYDIRHGLMGMRTTAKRHPSDKSEGEFFAVEITWTHILFYFAVLRYNMRTRPCSEQDVQTICQAEDALHLAVKAFSKRYANAILPFLNGAIYCANPHLMQFMEYINHQHLFWLTISTPKDAFGYLANEMAGAIYDSYHYREILKHLQKEAKRLDCDISELTYDYSQPPYDIKW